MTLYNIPASTQAAIDSINASTSAFDQSPLDPHAVAYAVGMEQAERDRKAKAARIKAEEASASERLHKAGLLGCWVDGTLRFQSREHENVHDYARRKMNERHQVWLAPVGSFQDK